jgi:hypothetical protein
LTAFEILRRARKLGTGKGQNSRPAGGGARPAWRLCLEVTIMHAVAWFRRTAIVRVAVAAGWLALVPGCGGSVAADARVIADGGAVPDGRVTLDAPGAVVDATVTGNACEWPASLDVTDAGVGGLFSGVCTGHRWLLLCAGSDGGGGSCILDDETRPSTCPGFAAGECHVQCGADEYVAMCQTFNAEPPVAGCGAGIRNPDQTFFCCACGR